MELKRIRSKEHLALSPNSPASSVVEPRPTPITGAVLGLC